MTPNGILEGKFGVSKFFAHYELDLQKFSPTTNRGNLPTSSSAIARETTVLAYLALQNTEVQAQCFIDFRNVCGTDGNTYGSECQLRLLSCRLQQNVQKAYDGRCQGSRVLCVKKLKSKSDELLKMTNSFFLLSSRDISRYLHQPFPIAFTYL